MRAILLIAFVLSSTACQSAPTAVTQTPPAATAPPRLAVLPLDPSMQQIGGSPLVFAGEHGFDVFWYAIDHTPSWRFYTLTTHGQLLRAPVSVQPRHAHDLVIAGSEGWLALRSGLGSQLITITRDPTAAQLLSTSTPHPDDLFTLTGAFNPETHEWGVLSIDRLNNLVFTRHNTSGHLLPNSRTLLLERSNVRRTTATTALWTGTHFAVAVIDRVPSTMGDDLLQLSLLEYNPEGALLQQTPVISLEDQLFASEPQLAWNGDTFAIAWYQQSLPATAKPEELAITFVREATRLSTLYEAFEGHPHNDTRPAGIRSPSLTTHDGTFLLAWTRFDRMLSDGDLLASIRLARVTPQDSAIHSQVVPAPGCKSDPFDCYGWYTSLASVGSRGLLGLMRFDPYTSESHLTHVLID